jgi:hypothetical protein
MSEPRRALARTYVMLLLGLLVVVQVRAEIEQVVAGYRPFCHPPSRVPYSWDMFAIRIERCVVDWDPPLAIQGRSVAHWRDRTWPLEFDSVYNEEGTYEQVARGACVYRSAPATAVALRCFLADGGVDARSFECP